MFIRVSSNFAFCLLVFLLSIQSILTIKCYECRNCTDIESCTCTNIYQTDDTNVHCVLLRETLSHGDNIEIEHRPNNYTDYHIYYTHYISVEESIVFNPTTKTWSSISNEIVFGCQGDLCNTVELLKKLPSNGLSLMLPSEWLNSNLQRNAPGDLALCRQCGGERICANSPTTFNVSLCPRADCHGSCLALEVFENAESEQLCYESLCTDDTIIGPNGELPSVNISAFYYIDAERFDIVEIDVACNADRCDTLGLFADIQQKLTKNLDNIQPFINPTTTPAPETTPSGVNSMYCTSIFFLIMLLSLQIPLSH